VTTPLDSIQGWTPEKISRMKDVWITTAEQVVALGATEKGLQSLSEQLKVDIEEARRLYSAALDRPADTREFGRGARPPPGKTEGDA
jgi:hypothetical protein